MMLNKISVSDLYFLKSSGKGGSTSNFPTFLRTITNLRPSMGLISNIIWYELVPFMTVII